MIALAITLQWADAVTFALIAGALPGLVASGELSPALPVLGVGGTLLAKAAVMFTVLLVCRRRLRGSRLLVAWTAALGAVGFATNAWFMIGGI